MLSYNEFILIVNNIYDNTEHDMRYGQIIMNILFQIWPEKYNEISRTEYDCFYEDGWTFATAQTLDKLKKEWTDNE